MRARAVLVVWICAVGVGTACAQTTLTGSSLALKSTGSGSGTWTLDRDGYVGTYINVAAPGNVTVRVNANGTASGGIAPHMNLVLADTKAGFDVTSGVNPYEYTFNNMPAGTYFLRTEFNNDLAVTSRALAIQDLTVTGATISNSSTNSNALAASDTYIQNFRKGNVKVGLSGLAPGATVQVSLKRNAFNFGTAVPGNSTTGVNNYFGTNGTTLQTNYQSRLTQNFNAVVPENAGKWSNNESTRDSVTMSQVDQILNFAQSHNMRARMHNLIWGDNSNNGQQPSWVLNNSSDGLLDQAYLGTNANAKTDLRDEISERIGYYVGTGTASDRDRKYSEIDVYNESFHTGADPNIPDGNPSTEPDYRHNYWNVYGPTGVADIYREVKQAIATSGANTKVYVNEYSVLGSSTTYVQHIETLRQAGIAAGYGDVVDGIGAQYYPDTFASHVPSNVMASMQNYAVQGKQFTLSEFGVSAGVSAADSATILGDMLRLSYGNPDSTGFFMWGFHQESGTGATTLFAPAAALYTVNTSDFNTWTLTAAGQKWQDMLGIQDWDGNTNNGWTTQLSTVVGPDGTINFNGFWGDYQLTVNGHPYNLTLSKGQNTYSLVIAPGDYNADGTVDAGDYVVWRRALQSADLRADGNGDGVIDASDYNVWKSHFGATYGSGSALVAQIPEPAAAILMLVAGVLCAVPRFRRAPVQQHRVVTI
jgi:GH35 family endo-1,4-beta-xylanase